MHFLRDAADQIASAGAGAGVIDRIVLELVNIEIGAQFAIDAAQQVEIKGPGDTLAVIIRIEDRLGMFFQVEPDQQKIPGPHPVV